MVKRLAAISHVKVIRVHTRMPVVAPERISAALFARYAPTKRHLSFCTPTTPELTSEARAACARLIDAGIPTPSQSVLLRGVNDDVVTLGALMRALVERRIEPDDLHHADLAPGTAHLRTTIAEGQALMRGLARPFFRPVSADYVLDIPDGLRQIADRSELCERRWCKRHCDDRGFQRAAASLSAAAALSFV